MRWRKLFQVLLIELLAPCSYVSCRSCSSLETTGTSSVTLQSPSHSTRQHHVETTGTAFLCKVSATKVLNVARYYRIPCFRWTLNHSCVVCGCVCECCRSDAVDNLKLVVLLHITVRISPAASTPASRSTIFKT